VYVTTTSASVKKVAHDLGADLCGIAPIERFDGAPQGFHPTDVLPSCTTVVVLASRFLHSALLAQSTVPYTTVRNELSARMNTLAVKLSEHLEREGATAVPMNSIGPDEWDAATNKFRGIISLKHAGVAAGLGKMGKNTLLLNDVYGNMIWLSAVFVAERLEPDPLATFDPCPASCTLCLDSCPVSALDGLSINQAACKNHAFGGHNGGEWRIKCYICRKTCPNALGAPGLSRV
jgi:epoxyqueuosine reductase